MPGRCEPLLYKIEKGLTCYSESFSEGYLLLIMGIHYLISTRVTEHPISVPISR